MAAASHEGLQSKSRQWSSRLAATYWIFAVKDDVEGFIEHGSARHVRWDTVRRTG